MSTRVQCCLFIAFSLITFALVPQFAIAAQRNTACYTAWDDYYFYAAFQVNDPHVNSVNRTPSSQPQEDDDVEVFFDTLGPNTSLKRTPGTYQMAVSAGGGAYFSAGDHSGKAIAKVVYTYKFATTVDGTLNRNDDTDIGYTVELAIPWQELGLKSAPKDGTIWGFNVINRDRDALDNPADKLASLSDAIQDASDIQNPHKWTKIEFVDGFKPRQSSENIVYCPHVTDHFPEIDGVVRSGEWNHSNAFNLGAPELAIDAPTKEEEPNVTDSPFDTPPTDQIPDQGSESSGTQTAPITPDNSASAAIPSQAQTPTQPNNNDSTVPDYNIELPGGGMVHVGKLPESVQTSTQAATPPVSQEKPKSKRHGKSVQVADNPLYTPPFGDQFPASGPKLDMAQSLALPEQTGISKLVMASYQCAFADVPADFVDQPNNSVPGTFGEESVQYQLEQLRDARGSGIDALLIVFNGDNSDQNEGLNSVVQAIRIMKQNGQDYPLLGLDASSADPSKIYDTIKRFYEFVPEEFRAEISLNDDSENKRRYVALIPEYIGTQEIEAQFEKDFDDDNGLYLLTDSHGNLSPAPDEARSTISSVSPVADSTRSNSGRALGQEYDSSWSNAVSAQSDLVFLNSWNNYLEGTEVAATRQYGAYYEDQTKLYSLQWNGAQEWQARYLKCNVPSQISPANIYTAQIRVENVGTLPWKLGEDYGLSYRWYKDGRLYDDSSPKIPLSKDILPGQSIDVRLGILAHNQYGNPLEPGDYILVIDMLQGKDRWFSLAGDKTLKIHIKVVGSGASQEPQAAFISSTLPSRIVAGRMYNAELTVRNDGSDSWIAGKTRIEYTVTMLKSGLESPTTGSYEFPSAVDPGSIARIKSPITINGKLGEIYRIKWVIRQPDSIGHLFQNVTVVGSDIGESFVLSEVPRQLKTTQTETARLGIANTGLDTWEAGKLNVTYRWYELDGATVKNQADVPTPIKQTINPGTVTAVTAKFTAPSEPGSYFLVWDVEDNKSHSGGQSSEKLNANAVLPVLVNVSPGNGSQADFVDLSRYANTRADEYETTQTGDMDGNGASIPTEMYLPDGTSDRNTNPVLDGVVQPVWYPSGYYVPPFLGGSDHATHFQFTMSKGDKNAVACSGQTISVQSGYQAVHILAARSDDYAKESQFVLNGTMQKSLTISSWSKSPSGSKIAFYAPYRLQKGIIDHDAPCIFGDYVISLKGDSSIKSITLPNDPNVKILAMTLVKVDSSNRP